MFDKQSIQDFTYVQGNKNKGSSESYLVEHVYKFFLRNRYGRSKYIMLVKEYSDGLLTVDFYKSGVEYNRYRVLTNEFSYGQLGATLLDIMRDIQDKTKCNTFGLLASNLLEEESNENNKRFRVYVEVLRRKVDDTRYQVFDSKEYSTIFVIPLERIKEKKSIAISYGKVFQETS